MREQQDQARRALGANFNPAMFESPEMRFAVLEQLVSQKLLAGTAQREHFNVSDAQLQQFIAAIPPFQVDGKFSQEKYQQLLATQNMTPLMFESRVRQDLITSAVQEPVAAANIVARPSAEKYLRLLEQQREVAVATIDTQLFAKDVKVDDAQVKAFYDQNLAVFKEESVVENLLVGMHSRLHGSLVDGAWWFGRVRREEIAARERVEEIIEFLEIESIRDVAVGTLSYGLQKRVELGRALAIQPKLLLLDEMVSGMNTEETEDIARFIIDLKEELGMTVLMVEHDMGIVMDISDHVCVLNYGRKIADGPPASVARAPEVIAAYLGRRTDAAKAA